MIIVATMHADPLTCFSALSAVIKRSPDPLLGGFVGCDHDSISMPVDHNHGNSLEWLI